MMVGKRQIARREIGLVIHSVMRARGMELLRRKESPSKIASGIRMEDWAIFTFTTSRNHLLTEEFLS